MAILFRLLPVALRWVLSTLASVAAWQFADALLIQVKHFLVKHYHRIVG